MKSERENLMNKQSYLKTVTLPGGTHYVVNVPHGVSSDELNHVMDDVRRYRAPDHLAGLSG